MQEYVQPHWAQIEQTCATRVHQLGEIAGESARTVVDRLGATITDMLQTSLDIALDMCPKTPGNVKGMHFRPRLTARRWHKLVANKRVIAAQLYKAQHPSEHSHEAKESATQQSTTTTEQRVANLVETYKASNPKATTQETLKALYKEMGHEQAAINKHHQKLALQEAIRQEQRMLEAKQKLGNKLATGQHKPTPAIACRVVKTAQGLVTDPKQVLEAMHEWCRAKLVAPEPGGKTGRYLPEEAQRNYPFDDRTDPDFRQYKDLLQRTAPNGPR